MTVTFPNLGRMKYPQFGPRGGLIGAWVPALSFGTALTLFDLSGAQKNAALSGIVDADWSVANGYGSLLLGTSKFGQIGNEAINRPAVVSVSVWFATTGTPSFSSLVCKPYSAAPWTSPYITYMLRVNNTTAIEYAVGDGSTYTGASGQITVPTIANNVPHHAILSYDGITLRAYYDGLLMGTAAFSGPLGYGAQPLYIGADHGASPQGGFFTGRIFSVAIYNRPLMQAEATQLWGLGPTTWMAMRRPRATGFTAAAPPAFTAKTFKALRRAR